MSGRIPSPFFIQDTSEKTLVGDILFPFAYDELLCGKVGEGSAPFVHIWRHEKAVVLGLRDRRLPNVEQAMEWLRLHGYQVGVRNTGGAAVSLDPGVVNVSIVMPNPPGKLEFKDDFELMYALVRESLSKLGLDAAKGEVAGSYCPGEYDVSVGGRKLCGISQRRRANAFIVNAFVNAEGHAIRRGELIRSFYEVATGGRAEPDVPDVRPETMATLAELGGPGATVRTFVGAVVETLKQWGGTVGRHPDKPSMRELEEMAATLRSRYDTRSGDA
ncbi:lipoate--protein ligase family protein [Paenibacillus flagellatus]|uniref:Ligase n=1 Tax=Paenibacillus flagellatus TaxID=2211139 RepID=A0A2V5KDY5_9BACL|nr:lipoate--protein ligase family protein [Paenibacillus flagellatus]PYI56233.1 ligase [Paenibacillus flagellatus]